MDSFKYFTEGSEEFTHIEDTDSEMEDFEGFTQTDLNVNSSPEVMRYVTTYMMRECGL